MAILGANRIPRITRAICIWLLAGSCAYAQVGAVREDDLKAAFLYNFAKYVEWPDGAFGSGTFNVCVIASTAFQKSVDAIIEGETVEGRPVKRQTPTSIEAARSCNILFLGLEGPSASQWLAAVRGTRVLTVGDGAGFLGQGAVMAFVREGDRVRFDVDVAEAQRAGLTISSRLLRVARHVSPDFEVR